MGCCQSRKNLESRFEDSLFIPFEKKIGLNKYQFLDLDVLLRKFSKLPHMSYFQVASLFEDLSLPFQDYIDFYNQFDRNLSRIVSEKKFSYLQLQSLSALLCRGEVKSKLRFLFNLYDPNSQRVLNKSKLEELLENILKVALDYIPGYFLLKTPDNPGLTEYQKTLKSGNDILLDQLSSKILRKKSFIGYDEFLCNVLKFFGKNLLSTEYLRERAYYFGVNGRQAKVRKNASKKMTVESCEPWLDDFSDVSNELVSTLQPRKLKHKKSISGFNQVLSYYCSEDGAEDTPKRLNAKVSKSNACSPMHPTIFATRSTYPKNFTCFTDPFMLRMAEIKSESEEIQSPLILKRNSTKEYIYPEQQNNGLPSR